MTEQKITYPRLPGNITYPEAANEVNCPDNSRLTLRMLPQPEPCRCGKSGEHHHEVILNSLGQLRGAAGLTLAELAPARVPYYLRLEGVFRRIQAQRRGARPRRSDAYRAGSG